MKTTKLHLQEINSSKAQPQVVARFIMKGNTPVMADVAGVVFRFEAPLTESDGVELETVDIWATPGATHNRIIVEDDEPVGDVPEPSAPPSTSTPIPPRGRKVLPPDPTMLVAYANELTNWAHAILAAQKLAKDSRLKRYPKLQMYFQTFKTIALKDIIKVKDLKTVVISTAAISGGGGAVWSIDCHLEGGSLDTGETEQDFTKSGEEAKSDSEKSDDFPVIHGADDLDNFDHDTPAEKIHWDAAFKANDTPNPAAPAIWSLKKYMLIFGEKKTGFPVLYDKTTGEEVVLAKVTGISPMRELLEIMHKGKKITMRDLDSLGCTAKGEAAKAILKIWRTEIEEGKKNNIYEQIQKMKSGSEKGVYRTTTYGWNMLGAKDWYQKSKLGYTTGKVTLAVFRDAKSQKKDGTTEDTGWIAILAAPPFKKNFPIHVSASGKVRLCTAEDIPAPLLEAAKTTSQTLEQVKELKKFVPTEVSERAKVAKAIKAILPATA